MSKMSNLLSILVVLLIISLFSVQVCTAGFALTEDFDDGDYTKGALEWVVGSPIVEWHEYNNALEGESLLDRCWKGDNQVLENHIFLYAALPQAIDTFSVQLRAGWCGDGLPVPGRQIGIALVDDQFRGYGVAMSQTPDFKTSKAQYRIISFNGPIFDEANQAVVHTAAGSINAKNDYHYLIDFVFDGGKLSIFARESGKEEGDRFEVLEEAYSRFTKVVLFRPAGSLAHTSIRYMNLEIVEN